jgi:3-phenylpropionate/trans-cinnamate dioxygenase ferredoxin reductase subunit
VRAGGVLVAGAGQAAVQLAVSLRDNGYPGPITLIGAETRPPYQRPPLSKAFLAGTADETAIALRTPEFYAAKRIAIWPGERVVKLHLSTAGPRGSGVAITNRGCTHVFDRLAIATGARPRRLTVPGADLDGVVYLRTAAEAADLRARLATAHHVVVVGGGFIGLEVASVARAAGRSVTVVEVADRLLSRVVAPVVSEFYRAAHVRRGTAVRLGVGVTAFDGDDGRVTGVLLADGTRLAADLVLVGVGVTPRTELAEGLGLACAGGIVVDELARTSEQAVVAAGDCTVMPNPQTGAGLVRLESMPNAVSQARTAAATLIGAQAPAPEVPWFWSDQYDLKLQIAGVADGHDDLEVRGDVADEKFAVRYYRGGRLLAVHAVNSAREYLTVRKELSDQRRLGGLGDEQLLGA